jgi:hypothetical protein
MNRAEQWGITEQDFGEAGLGWPEGEELPVPD